MTAKISVRSIGGSTVNLKKSWVKKPFIKSRWLWLSLFFIAAIAAVLLLTLHNRKPDLNKLSVIKSDVAKHLLLPNDEQPALATIIDRSKVSSPFLRETQNGDKLLIYQKNHKVIIYRPSIDRIVDIESINIDIPKNSTD